jgi:hypothetical protein
MYLFELSQREACHYLEQSFKFNLCKTSAKEKNSWCMKQYHLITRDLHEAFWY